MRIPGCRPEPRRSGGSLVLDAPNGQIKLDQNHQGISTSFVTEVIKTRMTISSIIFDVSSAVQPLPLYRRFRTYRCNALKRISHGLFY